MMEAQASSAVVRRPSGNAHLSCSSIQEEEEAADMSIEEIKKVDAEKMSILVSQLLAKNVIIPIFRRSMQKMHSRFPSFNSPRLVPSQVALP